MEEVRAYQKISEDSVLYKEELYDYFDEGLTRKVYVNQNKTKVIKLCIDSLYHNKKEFEIYKEFSEEDRDQMALTIMNKGVIEQEFCNPIKFDDRILTIKQTLFAKSCRDEVGWNSCGELVCFDLNEFKKY